MSAGDPSGPLGARPTIAGLAAVRACDEEVRGDIDWTALRGFGDWARRHPDELAAAVHDRPDPVGELLDALLAAFTEELCDIHGVERPQWTSDVPPLAEPWEPPGTPRMLERARRETPAAFRARNLTVAGSALCRADRNGTRRPATYADEVDR